MQRNISYDPDHQRNDPPARGEDRAGGFAEQGSTRNSSGTPPAVICCVGWGSTYGAIEDAVSG